MTTIVRTTATNYRVDIDAGHHKLVGDEPVAAGGGDAGPDPFDYLLAGLGACTAITLKMYAERKKWNVGELRVELAMQRDDDGRAHVSRVISSNAELDDEQWSRLLDVAGKTPVTKTLKEAMEISAKRG
jgi:putative redox protein